MQKVKDFIKNNKKLSIAILAIAILAFCAIALLIKQNYNPQLATGDEKKEPAITTEGIIKDEELNGLKFTNISLIREKDNFTMYLDVTNTTNDEINIETVNIPIKDSDGNTIVTLLGYIGDPLKPEETRTLAAGTSADLSNAVTKEIVEIK